MLNISNVEARAASRLNVPATDPELVSSVASAARYISTWIDVPEADLPADDPLLETGAVLLAVRIHLDTGVPSGALAAYGDLTLAGAVVPEDLDRHLGEYWNHLRKTWGTA
jgi:hypothetical protein